MSEEKPKREVTPGGGYKYARRPPPDGYKGHKKGSRKEVVHKAFDETGEEAAVAKAAELGIKAVSAKLWIKTWKKQKAT